MLVEDNKRKLKFILFRKEFRKISYLIKKILLEDQLKTF